jgi:LDH2 family malate/lactate/ureidoglycolate dehydrogenase
LQPYIQRIQIGGVDPAATPEVEIRGNLAIVDGKNLIGHHIGVVAADAASRLAAEKGVGLALVRNSNHFGFAGYYATCIAKNNQIGLVTSNGQVCVSPPGGLRSFLSNNPISIAAPIGETNAFFELDIATSVTSRAKIAQAAEGGYLIDKGLAVDQHGEDTEDALAALKGSLLPMGGLKGFMLLLAFEVMTGVLSGSAYAETVSSKETAPDNPEDLAQLMLAIDVEKAIGVDKFVGRMQDFIHRLEALPMKVGSTTLHYPGWDRWNLRNERLKNGIPISKEDYQNLADLATKLGVSIE